MTNFLPQVFEERLHTDRPGTGLGLPIARNISRAHGGDVTLANRPEGGLVAAASLPA
jgi:signal transduction histidine kinase